MQFLNGLDNSFVATSKYFGISNSLKLPCLTTSDETKSFIHFELRQHTAAILRTQWEDGPMEIPSPKKGDQYDVSKGYCLGVIPLTSVGIQGNLLTLSTSFVSAEPLTEESRLDAL